MLPKLVHLRAGLSWRGAMVSMICTVTNLATGKQRHRQPLEYQKAISHPECANGYGMAISAPSDPGHSVRDMHKNMSQLLVV